MLCVCKLYRGTRPVQWAVATASNLEVHYHQGDFHKAPYQRVESLIAFLYNVESTSLSMQVFMEVLQLFKTVRSGRPASRSFCDRTSIVEVLT